MSARHSIFRGDAEGRWWSLAGGLALACGPQDPVLLPVTDALSPPPQLWQADAFTLEAERGLLWEIDEAFSIPDHSVPSIYLRGDGSYVMMATRMDQAEARWSLSSLDGSSWTAAAQALVSPDEFSTDCGNRFEDANVLYLDDGSYLLLVEGSKYDEENSARPKWRRWCLASSPDGAEFQPLDLVLFEGGEADAEQISVPSALPLADGSHVVYYVGDLYGWGGIRALRLSADGQAVSAQIEGALLSADHVDPDPVYLQGGGLRLYLTYGLSGGAGYADTQDLSSFGEPAQLIANTSDCAYPGGLCLLDPAFLRLPDGELALYFTEVVQGEEGKQSFSIKRAFATD